MKATELRTKNEQDLNEELIGLRKEQFNLRMQRGAGQLANPARFNVVQKDIARIKTVLVEMAASLDRAASKEDAPKADAPKAKVVKSKTVKSKTVKSKTASADKED